MLALEQAVAKQNPNIRERLDAGRGAAQGMAREKASIGENPEQARAFFETRLKEAKARIEARVDKALSDSGAAIQRAGPRRSEVTNATEVVSKVRAALDDALAEERALWAAVPETIVIGTRNTKEVAHSLISATPRAQQGDIPQVLRLAVDDFAAGETVAEMHGLYSELRRVARSAMAGSDQNKNMARMANEVAEAVLKDAEGVPQLAEARAYSQQLHETFDRGAVGRILKRTLDGDGAIAPEAALSRTVGRGGASGVADDISLRRADGAVAGDIADYLRERFLKQVMAADGTFTPRKGAEWLRTNNELLTRYPALKGELRRLLGNRKAAEALAKRGEAAKSSLDDTSPARFLNGTPEQAARRVLESRTPAREMAGLVRAAAKDPSGQALAGLKGAFTRHLIGSPDTPLDGLKLLRTLNENKGALSRVYTKSEMSRLQRIGAELRNLEAKPGRDVGAVVDTAPNRLMEYVLRVAAARQAAQYGGGMAGGLQAAQMASSRVRDAVRGLTNDRATQVLMDAVEDPDLMRSLLGDPRSVKAQKAFVDRITPYLVGTAVQEGE